MIQKINIEKIKKNKTTEELLEFGIINIDKPQGPTSFSVSDYIRKALNLNKTSHMGTLDPQVSGVLPILLGRACRLSDYFMKKNKTYVGIMRLHDEIEVKRLNETIKKYIGKIKQLPPVRSAVKRQIREREVFSFDILEINGKDILFKTEVQAGTYIRTICDNIGKDLEAGAHMLELRRIKAGIFNEDKIYTLYDLDNAVIQYKNGNQELLREMIIPAEIISSILPIMQVNKEQLIKQLLTGKPIMKSDIDEEKRIINEERFCIFNSNKFVGIFKKANEGDIIARAEFVFN